MSFNAVRRLRAAELYLERQIDKVSEVLAMGNDSPDRLARAYRLGRPITRHKCWLSFLSVARPIDEARQHVEDERRHLEAEIEGAISMATSMIKRSR